MAASQNLARIGAIVAVSVLASSALAQAPVYTQSMRPGGGVLRNSQLWIDPADHDDSDNDSIAWASFSLDAPATVTRVEWWGQAMPPLGFEVNFYNQDPHTVASQPDIFYADSQPISEEIYLAPTVAYAGSGLYKFTVDLVTPLSFEADTRYFVSIVGRTPVFSGSWGWAQGDGPGMTFYWMRGAHMYFSLGDGRAFALSGIVSDPCSTADYNGDGLADILDFLDFMDDYGNCDGQPAPCGSFDPDQYSPDGTIDVLDFLGFFEMFGNCA